LGQIKAPFLRCEDISKIAADLLDNYNRVDKIPVDIEALVEFDIGLEIIPQRGLEDRFNVVGFISLDMTAITVDEYVLERQPTRYRFTLAHELGHRELHARAFESLQIKTIEDWRKFYMTLDEQDYGWFERHAYWFAGAILVPEHTLFAEYSRVAARLGIEGLDGAGLSHYGRLTVAGVIAKRFQVSTGVVHRRLNEVGLW